MKIRLCWCHRTATHCTKYGRPEAEYFCGDHAPPTHDVVRIFQDGGGDDGRCAQCWSWAEIGVDGICEDCREEIQRSAPW